MAHPITSSQNILALNQHWTSTAKTNVDVGLTFTRQLIAFYNTWDFQLSAIDVVELPSHEQPFLAAERLQLGQEFLGDSIGTLFEAHEC